MAQHAFTVSTGEPVGMMGAGIVGVLWGGPKDDGVPVIGTRSVLFLVAQRAVRVWRGRPCVWGEGGARRRRVEEGSGGSGEVRGGGCARGGGGDGCECSGEGRWKRIRERGIPDEWSPSEVSDHCTVNVRRLCGPWCERTVAGCHWEWRDCRASTKVPGGGSAVGSDGSGRCGWPSGGTATPEGGVAGGGRRPGWGGSSA